MDHPPVAPQTRRLRPRLLPGSLIAALVLTTPVVLQPPARAGAGMGSIVRAFCLSAFENEMSQAGRTAPEGMANFACSCVEGRLRDGSTLELAKRDCRQATVRRYPI